ncbi:MAG: ATP-binding cassette domain-containing protein [Bacteroidales bacterium]|nr:ATP-binding cassette domain-containing protein [Bacteroidales bacterium]
MSISVKGVTKLFGKQKALDNVSFSVPTSSVVGFLGPNGAGKSTMMKIITGYLKPTEGEVEVNGVSVNDGTKDFRKFIGYLPENNPLYTDMYVKEYLCFVSKIYGLGRFGVRRVNELIELTGIGNEQNKKIGQLSRGFRQRVGLAQALLNRPPVLILDEPTSGLDPNQIVEIRKIIVDVGKEKTVLLSTHIMQEVEAICSSVMIINKGKIIANDSTQNILKSQSVMGQSVHIELINDVKESVLAKIPGVEEVVKMDEPYSWLLSTTKAEDIRPSIFTFCAEHKLTVITLKQKSMQMEEVFQTLTKE